MDQLPTVIKEIIDDYKHELEMFDIRFQQVLIRCRLLYNILKGRLFTINFFGSEEPAELRHRVNLLFIVLNILEMDRDIIPDGLEECLSLIMDQIHITRLFLLE